MMNVLFKKIQLLLGY